MLVWCECEGFRTSREFGGSGKPESYRLPSIFAKPSSSPLVVQTTVRLMLGLSFVHSQRLDPTLCEPG